MLVYLDGKRVPMSGQDLSNYLQNLPAEQIDRIDIITNPGAKYEAQGNAGIIDIRLKRQQPGNQWHRQCFLHSRKISEIQCIRNRQLQK